MNTDLVAVPDAQSGQEAIALAMAAHRRRAVLRDTGVRYPEAERLRRQAEFIAKFKQQRDAFMAQRAQAGEVNQTDALHRENIKRELSSLISQLPPGPQVAFAARIIGWVCKRRGVSVKEIIGHGKKKKVMSARTLAVQMIKHHPVTRMLTLGKISEIMGGRDHSSILHLVQKAPSSARLSAISARSQSVEETLDALELRLSGLSWPEISKIMGGSPTKFGKPIRSGLNDPASEMATSATARLGLSLEEIKRRLADVTRKNSKSSSIEQFNHARLAETGA